MNDKKFNINILFLTSIFNILGDFDDILEYAMLLFVKNEGDSIQNLQNIMESGGKISDKATELLLGIKEEIKDTDDIELAETLSNILDKVEIIEHGLGVCISSISNIVKRIVWDNKELQEKMASEFDIKKFDNKEELKSIPELAEYFISEIRSVIDELQNIFQDIIEKLNNE
ncbi:hypothetical protein ACTPC6_11375 [Clostridioides difficile]